MKNNSPKAEILNLLEMSHPLGVAFEVFGTRVKGRFGGYYLTEARVNDRLVATARHRDWRKSYKMLGIEVSKSAVI